MRLLVNWALAVGSCPVVKLLGGRGVVGLVSSSWLAASCWQLLCSDCFVFGLWLWAQTWSTSCLAAGVRIVSGVVKMTGGSERAVALCCDCKGLGLLLRV